MFLKALFNLQWLRKDLKSMLNIFITFLLYFAVVRNLKSVDSDNLLMEGKSGNKAFWEIFPVELWFDMMFLRWQWGNQLSRQEADIFDSDGTVCYGFDFYLVMLVRLKASETKVVLVEVVRNHTLTKCWSFWLRGFLSCESALSHSC